MAKATITHITDDIDGTPDAATVTFGLMDVAYSIDLGQKNTDKLAKALAPFIKHATKRKGAVSRTRKAGVKPAATTKPTTKAAKSSRAYDLVQLREWAGKNKIKVPSRGRIPGAVVQQYQASGGH
jgi:hypothetical protein